MVIGGRACGIVGFAHALPNTPLTWLDRDFGKAVGAAADKHGLGTIVAVPSMSDDCRRIILTSSDRRTYLRFHLLDRKTDTVRHLGGHDVGVANRSSTERRMVRYRTREGLALPMALTLPTTVAGPPPVIVLLDDGANEDVESLDTWPHYFAQRGYAVAQPAIRGYRGYGAEFQLAGLRMRGRRMQEDVADALAWLAGEGVVDGESRASRAAAGAPTSRWRRSWPEAMANRTRHVARRHTPFSTPGRPSVGTTSRWTRASAAGFPCGDWEDWAAPAKMRRIMSPIRRYVPDRLPEEDTLYRPPLAEPEHPGIPILVKTEGPATVHEKASLRFRADVEKVGFFQKIAPGGGDFETEFLDEAVSLFDRVLLGAEDNARRSAERAKGAAELALKAVEEETAARDEARRAHELTVEARDRAAEAANETNAAEGHAAEARKEAEQAATQARAAKEGAKDAEAEAQAAATAAKKRLDRGDIGG